MPKNISSARPTITYASPPHDGDRSHVYNEIVLSLPAKERDELLPQLEFVRLKLHQVLHEPGETLNSGYFCQFGDVLGFERDAGRKERRGRPYWKRRLFGAAPDCGLSHQQHANGSSSRGHSISSKRGISSQRSRATFATGAWLATIRAIFGSASRADRNLQPTARSK